jgi:hypothetical protein
VRHRLAWSTGWVEVTIGPTVAVDVRVTHDGRLLVIRDDGIPRPRAGALDIRADGLWLSLVDEGDGRWTLGLEAFALEVDDPDDERGTRVPLGLDVEWDAGRLHGELLVGDDAVALDEPATSRSEQDP